MALLALLASTRHHVLARDKLIGLLWPETDTASARGLLSASVHTIRKALGEEVLVSEGEALRLDVSRIGIDTLDFEARYDLGDCEGAVALHSGPFLDGFSIPDSPEFDQWMDTERERLERLYYSCLDQLAGTAETGGDPASAVTWWRRRLGCTPTDARVVVRLMEALARAGDRAGALMAAAAHARLMAEELGASPDPEVFALERALRGASPAESAVPGFDGDTPNPVGGRAPELSESAKHLESANGVELPTVSPGRSPGVLRTRWLLATALVMLVTTFGLLAALRLDVRDPDVTSLLVLPFDDLGGPAGSGYFVEGMYGARPQ